MELRLRLRALIFPCILTSALALAALTLIFFLRGGEAPAGLVNSRIPGRLAARYGVQYSVQSLRVGSLLEQCRSPLDAGGIQLSFRDLGPVYLRIDRLRWCSTEPLAIQGLTLGGPTQPDAVEVQDAELNAGAASIRNLSLNVGNVSPGTQLAVGGIEFSTTGNAVASDIRISTASDSSASIQRVSLSPLVFSRQTGLLNLDSIDAAGVAVRFPGSSPPSASAPSICERTQSVISAGSEMAASVQHSVDALTQTQVRLRRDLLYLSFFVPAVLFLLKIWTTSWTHKWALRVLLGALAVLPPAALYGIAGRSVPLLQLVMLSFAISFLLAILMRFRVYRQAPRWYQRWEPFTVDVASFVIVLPLAASSFGFGAPFRPPAALEVGRMTVADVSLNGAQSPCGVRRVLAVTVKDAAVEQLHLDLPDTSQESSSVRIAKVDLPGIFAGIHDERTPDLESVTISGASASADAIGVTIDWKSRQIRGLDARIRARGVATTRTWPFGPPSRQGTGLDFAADLRVAGGRGRPALSEDLQEFEDPAATVAFRGAIAFDPERCDLSYAWAARVLSGRIRMVSTGLGDSEAIDIRSIRTLPGSTFQVANGSGRVSMAQEISASLRLLGLRAPAGASQVQIASAELSGAVTPSCTQIDQTLSAGINGTQIEIPGGVIARIERTELKVKRETAAGTNPASLIATIRDARFTDRSAPEIGGNLPLLRLALEGATTPEMIPRRFEGGLALSLSTMTDVLLRNDPPLKILGDIRGGAVTVPDQQQVLLQSITARLPRELPLSLSLEGGLSSGGVATHVRVPRLSMNLGSLPTEIRDLQIDADTRTPALTFESGWNRLSLPKLSNVFCLEEISQFDLATEGEISRLVLPQTRFLEFRNPVNRCAQPPSLPAETSFRFQGAWPSIRLEGSSGFGIRIRDIGRVELQKADLRDGRLRSLELQSKISGIQTLGGDGELGVSAHVTIAEGAGSLTTSLLGANDVSLVDMALKGLPARADIEVLPRTATDELVNALRPFLSSAGLSLRGITPRARIERLQASLQFEGERPGGLNARLDVGAGPLASIDYPADDSARSSALRKLDLSIIEDPANPSVNSLRLNLSRNSAEIHADFSGLSLRAADARGAEIQTTLSLHTTINGTISERRSPPDPILTTVSGTIDGMRRHVDSAVRVFGNPAPAVSQPSDFSWKFRIQNGRDGESLLRLAPENVRIRLAGDVEKFTWRTGQGERSRVAASGEFAGDLALHDGQLVLDAYAPARLEASLGPNPARKVEVALPLLVAFSAALRGGDAPGALWDSEYYTRFWNSYRVTEANRGTAPVVDTARFVAGPMSLRQIVIPIAPLRIAVGHGERFELHVPFSGRTLFGAADGMLQTALMWRGNQASVDSRFNLALRNIQAGAVGLDSPYGHTPFIEDELDGDVVVRTENWQLDRTTFDRILASQSPQALDALSLSLELRKSQRSQSIPGMLQLSSDTQVNLLNALLNRILRNLQLAGPPQKMSYRNLMLDFRMDNGKVATEAPWLRIDGLRLFSSTNLDVEGNIRLHGGRYGETLELRNLLNEIIPR